MDTLGHTLRKLGEEKKLPLRTVASFLDIDQAILSKLERGQRKATRPQVLKLAQYFNANVNNLLVAWLADNLVYHLEGEDIALKALQVAEDRNAYATFKKIDRNQLREEIIDTIKSFSHIKKAWIYGSFSRGDDGPKSDIDIAIKTDEGFSYFDLAEVQFNLEKIVSLKVDVSLVDYLKPYIFEHVKSDLKLIYER